jgi:hypothetical protein
MKKITIDVWQIVRDNTALIISHPTGIEYEVQAGGLSCTHPTCRGFVINLNDLGKDVDECAFGCAEIEYEIDLQNRFALFLDDYLKNATKDWPYQIAFDYDRLTELQEGWWPVVVTGLLDGGIIATKHVSWKGYIHAGNCD